MLKKNHYIIVSVRKNNGHVSCAAEPHQHSTLGSAEKEAERLTLDNPLNNYSVLEVLGTCVKQTVAWK